MSVRKHIGSDKVGAILALNSEGYTNTEIHKWLKVARSTVKFWVDRSKITQDGSVPSPKCCPGRTPKTSEKTNNLIKRIVLNNPMISCREIKQLHPD